MHTNPSGIAVPVSGSTRGIMGATANAYLGTWFIRYLGVSIKQSLTWSLIGAVAGFILLRKAPWYVAAIPAFQQPSSFCIAPNTNVCAGSSGPPF